MPRFNPSIKTSTKRKAVDENISPNSFQKASLHYLAPHDQGRKKPRSEKLSTTQTTQYPRTQPLVSLDTTLDEGAKSFHDLLGEFPENVHATQRSGLDHQDHTLKHRYLNVAGMADQPLTIYHPIVAGCNFENSVNTISDHQKLDHTSASSVSTDITSESSRGSIPIINYSPVFDWSAAPKRTALNTLRARTPEEFSQAYHSCFFAPLEPKQSRESKHNSAPTEKNPKKSASEDDKSWGHFVDCFV